MTDGSLKVKIDQALKIFLINSKEITPTHHGIIQFNKTENKNIETFSNDHKSRIPQKFLKQKSSSLSSK